MISLDEALARIEETPVPRRTEIRPLAQAAGYVLADDILADRDYPPFDRSMMDGFALSRQFLLDHPGRPFPVVGRILAGSEAPEGIPEGCAIRIMTGAPVPRGLDLVIPLENAESSGALSATPPMDSSLGSVAFPSAWKNPPSAYANIARQGEDCRAGEALLSRGTVISPATMGALAAVGAAQVRVCSLPRVGLITTGSELVDVGAHPLPHQIRDSNGWTVRAFLHALGIEPTARLCVPDTREALRDAIADLIDCDVLILTGAVSAGDTDFVPEVLAEAGVREVFHGVSIKPGKPVWFGRGPAGPVVGLPGNPFAVQCGMRIFAVPLLCRFLGLEAPVWRIPLASDRRSRSPSRDEFFPAALVQTGIGIALRPLSHGGSGDIAAAAASDGIGLHLAAENNLAQGDLVSFFAWHAIRAAIGTAGGAGRGQSAPGRAGAAQ